MADLRGRITRVRAAVQRRVAHRGDRAVLINASSTALGVVLITGLHRGWPIANNMAVTGLLVVLLIGAAYRNSMVARRGQEAFDRRANTFEGSPVALWEEDFSAVGRWLESLKESGVADLRTFLVDQPGALDQGIGLVRILAVNEAARRMIDSPDSMFLFGSESGIAPRTELQQSMTEQFVAIWENEDRSEVRISGTTTGGQQLDGVLYWQSARFSDGRLDLSKVMVAIVDVTDRVAAESRLRHIVENRERLIAAISHELRTPLTSVIGFLLVLDELTTEKLGSEGRFMLAAATQEAEHLGSLVEDLLIAAHHGIGEIPVRQIPVVMDEIMQQTAATAFSGRPRETGLGFDVESGLVAVADPVRVRQILRNLLTNSVRYGGDLRRVVVYGEDSDILVRVIDDGAGVDANLVDGLFEPYRPSQASSSMPGSLGLGLAISRALARAMRGDLTYHRSRGETVFELRLPKQASPDASAVRPGLPLGESSEVRESEWAIATLPALFDDSGAEIVPTSVGTSGVRALRRAERPG